LAELSKELNDISLHAFNLQDKDGYLATNSLLLDATLIARAYDELNNDGSHVPASIADLRLGDMTIDDWLTGARQFIAASAARPALIVTFSPLLRAVAADLESKLAESALLHCQLADLRSFAHGRHLWLADRPHDCAVLALIEPSLEGLWDAMRALLPPETPTLTMPCGGAKPGDLLAGLVAQMKLVSLIAQAKAQDPGAPTVAQFGRDLHYLKVSDLIPTPPDQEDGPVQAKYEVLGAHWPSVMHPGTMRRAMDSFREELEQQTFRAIVFDYDGTLCTSQRKDNPPPEEIVDHLKKLIDDGVIIAIASGRGDSIQEKIKECLPREYWSKVRVGLYNAGYIADLATPPPEGPTSEFLSHVTRIAHRLQAMGVPIEKVKTTHPHQVSIRFRAGVHTATNWFVVADALRQAGLDMSRVVRSKHSVDILAKGVDKSHLAADIIKDCKIDPYEILTMGDQGAWPGNDASLLEHRYSLSVDVPSRRLDRGWKLAPGHKRDVDATVWYLERVRLVGGGAFKLNLSRPPGAEAIAAP
jgi:hypothetical protein